ncbi:Chaperone protein dnak [Globisporangium polare]
MQLKKQQRSVALRSRVGALRHFHATQQQPVWFLVAGAGCAALFLGSRYVLRAQERIRRKREGLPVDDYDDGDSSSSSTDSYARRGTPARRMTQILGVDFGTANLRLSVAALQGFGTPSSSPANDTLNSNPIRVIESADGLRAIPAAVAVDNGSVSVGVLAKSLLGRKPGYTGTATRLLLEHKKDSASSEEWNRFLASLPYKINAKDGEGLEIELDGKTYSPEWAAEIMLDHVHSMAARSLGENGGDNDGFPAIISVPAGLSDAQRDAFERVASSAGFEVITSVDEPIAALHAAELSALEDEDEASIQALTGPGTRIAVFDMGGYKSSITLLERAGHGGDSSGFKILESKSSSTVSGRTVDDLLFGQVVSKFQRESGIDLSIDHMASYRVLEAVETAKIELSSRRNTDLNLPFITADRTGAKHLVQKLSAYDLSRACEDQGRQAKALCDQALASAGLKKEDVDLLVLVGGGVRSEPIHEQLEKYFGKKAFSGRNFKPEEAVVVGAAEFGRRLASG